MSNLYYCNTIYTMDPPNDINPLILARHPTSCIFVLCARESMIKRISNKVVTEIVYQYPNQSIITVGWWNLDTYGYVMDGVLNIGLLEMFDIIIIVSKERIDSKFLPLVKAIEEFASHR